MGTILGMDAIGFWIVVTGALVGISGALLGSFLVLRRLSLMGDAISHAVLPGLALAFWITSSRSPIPMLLGAMAAGLVTVVLTELIRRFAKVPEDASLGVVFTSMFALGVVMISRTASDVDLDTNCVLEGVLETAALDTRPLWGFEIPGIALNMAVLTVGVILMVTILWKELKLVAFDAALADTLGLRSGIVHGILMFAVAAFCVMAFEAVGSILVVAMLIVPAAAAYMLTDRLWVMVLVAAGIGVSSAIFGRQAALTFETTVAGMMAVAAGAHLVVAVLFGPRHGYLAKQFATARIALRMKVEDITALLIRWRERRGNAPLKPADAREALGGGFPAYAAMLLARLGGWVAIRQGALVLTDSGTNLGRRQVRKHRLWEMWLATHSTLPDDHLHGPADRIEHFLDEAMTDSVAAELNNPTTDPHGSPIREE